MSRPILASRVDQAKRDALVKQLKEELKPEDKRARMKHALTGEKPKPPADLPIQLKGAMANLEQAKYREFAQSPSVPDRFSAGKGISGPPIPPPTPESVEKQFNKMYAEAPTPGGGIDPEIGAAGIEAGASLIGGLAKRAAEVENYKRKLQAEAIAKQRQIVSDTGSSQKQSLGALMDSYSRTLGRNI